MPRILVKTRVNRPEDSLGTDTDSGSTRDAGTKTPSEVDDFELQDPEDDTLRRLRGFLVPPDDGPVEPKRGSKRHRPPEPSGQENDTT